MNVAERDDRLGNPTWEHNWTVGGGLRMEIMNLDTRDVWLCQEPVTAAEADDLTLPAGFIATGLAGSVADLAYFSQSPGESSAGELETMDVGGRRFVRVARPIGQNAEVTDAVALEIDKYHTLMFRAGRTIDVLADPSSQLLVPAWTPQKAEEVPEHPRTPNGWLLRRIELVDDLLVTVPNPATVLITIDGYGFHGPVTHPHLEISSEVAE